MSREIVERLGTFESMSASEKVTVSAYASSNATRTNTPFELAIACLEIITSSHEDTLGLRHLANAVDTILSQRLEELTGEQAEKLVSGTQMALRKLSQANLRGSSITSRLQTGLMVARTRRNELIDIQLRRGEQNPGAELRRYGLNFSQLRRDYPQRMTPCQRYAFY
mgnify:CR=1 FL=1